MGKKKLIHFKENLTFPHLFQPTYQALADGFALQGRWHEEYFHNPHPIVLELGCGKGEYTVGLAMHHPGRNFIGIDLKGARLWKGCRIVEDNQLSNVAFVRTRVDHILKIFGKGEVSEIWITFPDPHPGKERVRLTSPGFLEKYRQILIPGGIIHLKTDDRMFFEYTMGVIGEEGHQVLLQTSDLYSSHPVEEVCQIQTYYEQKWLEMGKKINYIRYQLNHYEKSSTHTCTGNPASGTDPG